MSRLTRGLTGLNNTNNPSNFSRAGGPTMGGQDRQSNKSFEELKRLIHGKLVDKLDLSRVSDLAGDTLRREIRLVVERLCDTENPLLNRMERERLIDEVLDETFGFGPLEVLLKDPTISDILVNGPYKIMWNVAENWKRPTSSFATTSTCCKLSIALSRRSAAVSMRRR